MISPDDHLYINIYLVEIYLASLTDVTGTVTQQTNCTDRGTIGKPRELQYCNISIYCARAGSTDIIRVRDNNVIIIIMLLENKTCVQLRHEHARVFIK